jgi:DNA (cytosine-5)-methyltransferase 1
MGYNPPIYGYHPGSVTDLLEGEHMEFLNQSMQQSWDNGNMVGFIGGPPCPDFSIGGKNRGRDGDNGQLSLSYIRLICQHLPDFFLFENVKGLYRTNVHRQFFNELKDMLRDAGYILTEKLINAMEYGAPQDRDRILLFGAHADSIENLGAIHNPFTNTFAEGEFPWERYAIYPGRTAFNFPWPNTTPFIANDVTLPPADIPIELTVEHWFQRNNVANHPNALNFFQPRKGLARFLTIAEGDDKKKSFKRLHRWRYSPTAAYGNNEVHLHPYLPRRISAAEALAIQTLPPEFVLPEYMTLSNKFKTIGNGVPYLAGRAIARSISDFLQLDIQENQVQELPQEVPANNAI